MSTLKQIIQLHRQGAGIKRIARSLGISKNTVRKYLRCLESGATTLAASEEALIKSISRPNSPTQARYEHFQSLLPYLEKELQKTGVTAPRGPGNCFGKSTNSSIRTVTTARRPPYAVLPLPTAAKA